MKEKYFIDMRKTSGKNIGKSCCKKILEVMYSEKYRIWRMHPEPIYRQVAARYRFRMRTDPECSCCQPGLSMAGYLCRNRYF